MNPPKIQIDTCVNVRFCACVCFPSSALVLSVLPCIDLSLLSFSSRSFSFISLLFLKGQLTWYTGIDTHLTHTHKGCQAWTHTNTHTGAHAHSIWVLSILVLEASCFVETREYFLLKGLIYNRCTVLRHCPAIGFVFIVIYYSEDIFSVWNFVFWRLDWRREARIESVRGSGMKLK